MTDVLEVYPKNFAEKIGYTELRTQLLQHCASPLGREVMLALEASRDYDEITRALGETHEMLSILSSSEVLPSLALVDCREALQRIRPLGTYVKEEELIELLRMLETLHALRHFFLEEQSEGSRSDESLVYRYPHLSKVIQGSPTFPKIEAHLRSLLTDEGKLRDNASRELLSIRTTLRDTERSLSGMLQRILQGAQREGWVERDVQPALRDGRLVIPMSPTHKRKIRGIVHDESATGKTVYVEPVELVEANNRIRELEGEERREVIRILTEVSNRLRPNIEHLLSSYATLAHLDFTLAKARWAREVGGICPTFSPEAEVEWYGAKHPLLLRSLRAQGRSVVPLDIRLEAPEARLLLISGPNAGGKSVCLKTVGLLQYLIQCGIPVPMQEHSRMGLFDKLYIDIGDEQSIEDDLSTYSSHLRNMKQFVRGCDGRTLLLIDEFGGGTEPTIGGAIAQALLHRFNEQGALGVITTHYQNLKTYAEEHTGLINGAMLYDRHEMRPLFRLSIGRPGSSFAIEIARKIGLPEEILDEVTEQVGSDYVAMDKYLQDIIRDKRYWEGKRQTIRRDEKLLQEATDRYSEELSALKAQRKKILEDARREAQTLIKEASGRIERTIREIREAEAERDQTRLIRQRLTDFGESLTEEGQEEQLAQAKKAQREVERILARRSRQKERKAQGKTPVTLTPKQIEDTPTPTQHGELQVGSVVRIDGQKALGTILSLTEREAVIALGALKTTIPRSRLHLASEAEARRHERKNQPEIAVRSTQIIDQIHQKRLNFRQEIDVRGFRANEAVDAVAYFVDEALQLGVAQVRVLHGTGTGALRESIRSYLSGVSGVRDFHDEDVRFGGAGITVIEMN